MDFNLLCLDLQPNLYFHQDLTVKISALHRSDAKSYLMEVEVRFYLKFTSVTT